MSEIYNDQLQSVITSLRYGHPRSARRQLEAVRTEILDSTDDRAIATFVALDIGIDRELGAFHDAAHKAIFWIRGCRKIGGDLHFSGIRSLLAVYSRAGLYTQVDQLIDWALQIWDRKRSSWHAWYLDYIWIHNELLRFYSMHPMYADSLTLYVDAEDSQATSGPEECLRRIRSRLREWTIDEKWSAQHPQIAIEDRVHIDQSTRLIDSTLERGVDTPEWEATFRQAIKSGNVWLSGEIGRAAATVEFTKSRYSIALAIAERLSGLTDHAGSELNKANSSFILYKCQDALGLAERALDSYRRHCLIARRVYGSRHSIPIIRQAECTGFDRSTTQTIHLAERAMPAYVRQAVKHIESRLEDVELTVSSVASACGVSERSLLNGFRVYIGVTPLAYIRQVRGLRAEEMLKHGGADPNCWYEVMSSCGFRTRRQMLSAIQDACAPGRNDVGSKNRKLPR